MYKKETHGQEKNNWRKLQKWNDDRIKNHFKTAIISMIMDLKENTNLTRTEIADLKNKISKSIYAKYEMKFTEWF